MTQQRIKLDDRVEALRVEYGLEISDFWELPQKRGSYCAKHSALEVIAAKAKIRFDPPQVLEANSSEGTVSILVTGHFGDRSVWSVGECSPKNCKNAYPWAMAEKRGIDRVVLKLVGIHGLVYSEDEMPSTAPEQENKPISAAPPKTEPAQKPKPLSKASDEARNTYSALVKDMRQCTQADDLVRWWKDLECVELRKKLPQDWQDNLRKEWVELGTELRSKQTEEFPGSGVTDVSGRELNNVEG